MTAQSRTSDDQQTGYVILNSRVTSSMDQGAEPMDAATPGAKSAATAKRMVGLGRPWRAYARTVYLNTSLPPELNPAGWNNWGKPENEKTAWYGEYGSTGLGAASANRVPGAHPLKTEDVKKFLPANFLRGSDNWDPEAAATKLP